MVQKKQELEECLYNINMAIIKLNNNALTSVTELPSGVGQDPDVKIDIARLGLRVFANQNLSKQNSNSASYDVFTDSTGITGLTNAVRDSSGYVFSATQSYSDAGYTSGDKTSLLSASTNGTWTAFSTYLINGNTGYQADVSFTNGYSQSQDTYVRFDRGSANSWIWRGVKFIRQNSTSQAGGSTWVWRASNNGTSWTDLLTGQSWGGANPKEYTWSNTTPYRYLEFYNPNAFTSNNTSWEYEWEFKRSTASSTINATGSFEGTTITADSSTNKMGAVITYEDNAGTNALNSDLVLKLSADNGSNYSTATLTALPDFSSGVKCCSVTDLSVTAGTQLKYKIEFANQSSGSKECRVTGVSLQY